MYLCKGISPQNMPLYDTVPTLEDPEIPMDMQDILMVYLEKDYFFGVKKLFFFHSSRF